MATVTFQSSPAYIAGSNAASWLHRCSIVRNKADLLGSPRSSNPGKIDIRSANGNLTHHVRLDQLVKEATTEKPNGAR